MSGVLVTGGSGFVATWTIAALLERGDSVRATVRSAAREEDVRAMVAAADAPTNDRLEVVVADLGADAGWAGAVDGCDYVLHIASPFPPAVPRNEDELIVPARDGTIRVLRAAREAGVRRVVMTSSFAAVGYGPAPVGRPFDERDWTETTQPGLDPYLKSKTVAERAAWEFVEREGRGLELTALNPVGIFGPVLGPDYASSIGLIQRLLAGQMPVVPRMFFNIVDVRDIAAAQVLALDSAAAAGERFIVASQPEFSLPQIANLLRSSLGQDGSAVSTRAIPDWAVRVGARFNPALRAAAPQVGRHRLLSNAKAVNVLGWSPRNPETAILETAHSLLNRGLVSNAHSEEPP